MTVVIVPWSLYLSSKKIWQRRTRTVELWDKVELVVPKQRGRFHACQIIRKTMISFDIIVWRTKLAPLWIQKSGLEWCYRIYQEPRMMWKRYAKTNPVFVWMVVKEYVKRRAQRAKSSKRSTDFADLRIRKSIAQRTKRS